MVILHRLGEHLDGVLRAETFNDRDGARTGRAQTLQSYSIGPAYVLGTGREGVFANIEHTTIRSPRFQIRAEARLDGSSRAFFEGATGTASWDVRYVLQLLTTF